MLKGYSPAPFLVPVVPESDPHDLVTCQRTKGQGRV